MFHLSCLGTLRKGEVPTRRPKAGCNPPLGKIISSVSLPPLWRATFPKDSSRWWREQKDRFVTVDAIYELEEIITNDSRNSIEWRKWDSRTSAALRSSLCAISSAQMLFVFSDSVAFPKLNLCYEINYEMKSTLLLQAALRIVP